MFTLAWVIPSADYNALNTSAHVTAGRPALRQRFCASASVGHTRPGREGIVPSSQGVPYYYYYYYLSVRRTDRYARTGFAMFPASDNRFRRRTETREASMFTAAVINHQTTAAPEPRCTNTMRAQVTAVTRRPPPRPPGARFISTLH